LRQRVGARTIAGLTGLTVLGGGIAVGYTTLTAGPRPDGTAITPVGFRVTPAGRQTPLGDLPLASRLSPDGKWLLVSNDGQGTQSLQLVDTATSSVVQTIPYKSPASLFVGLAFSPDGSTAYVSGGGDEKIHVYAVAGGHLTEQAPIPVPAVTAGANMYPAGLDVTPDGRRLVVADHLAESASVIDLATKAVSSVAVGHAPYGVVVSHDGRTAYVSNQGANSVSVLDLTGAAPTVQATVPVGTHPNSLVLDAAGARLFVADGDSDTISVVDTAAGAVSSTIALAPYPHANVGTTPVGLALSADEATLYVANAGNNDVAVVDTRHGNVRGLIPTAWHPSSVNVHGDDLLVTNAKGLGAGPNDGAGHPDPTSPLPTAENQYVGSMMQGSLSTIAIPSANDLEAGTRLVATNDGFAEQHGEHGATPKIQHVIYVVKENRTYDQVLGSLGKGNGDPSLNLFGDESAPNARALQRKFVTLDNFYANAEISAQGWNWSTQANSNPFTEALWPANYSGRNAPYPSENGDPAIVGNTTPSDGFVWDRLADKGVSFRNYGFYVSENPDHTFTASDPRLDANTDHSFRGYDLSCPDSSGTFTPRKATCGTPRIDEWLREFTAYEAAGTLPTVEFLRLPNDHTAGTRPGYPTPQAYVADNDLAVGRLVDAVSHSKDWASTAIFITEDDAQNGPDHVDAHRTVSQVVSPYSQHGTVDSTFYSTASLLRSIENIVGIAPLTQFDAFSNPMSGAFSHEADTASYTAVRPAMAGNILNGATAPMAAASVKQSLVKEDQIDEQTFNEAIWQSVRGAGSPMPAPRHALQTAESSPSPAADDE
jgi:YVTN family beta-propeller protein